MQSGGKIQLRGGKQRSNPKNSFVPSENSFNNEFLSHESQAMQEEESQQIQNNSRVKGSGENNDRNSHKVSNESSRIARNEKNGMRNHLKMEVIREENINVKANSPPKQKSKKTPTHPSQVHQEMRKPSPRRIAPVYNNQVEESQQTQQEPVEEQKKIKDLNAGMERLSESLLDLRQKYHQFQQEQSKHKMKQNLQNKSRQKVKSMIFGEKTPQNKEKQFKQILKNLHKEKQARKKVLDQIAEIDKQKNEQYKIQKYQEKQLTKLQRIAEIKALSKFQEKHKQMKQQQQQRKKAIEQFVKKYEGKQSIIRRKQKQDKQKQLQQIQQQKLYLAERRQMFKPINFQDIDQHQKWYYDKIELLNNQRRELKEEEIKKIQEQNAQFPDFYKGKAHQIALEERLQKVRKKKVPIEKIKRIENYREYVRENFVPRTHQNKSMQQSQLRNDASLTHRDIKRFRYYKGVSYGQVVETRPIAKSQEEIKRMGHHNFEYMKKLPKRRDHVDAYEIRLLQQSQSSSKRLKREDHHINEEKKVKDTKVVLPQTVKTFELEMIMRQLKSNDEKLKHKQYALNSQPQIFNEYLGQRQINQRLVESIQKKLSLLSQL